MQWLKDITLLLLVTLVIIGSGSRRSAAGPSPRRVLIILSHEAPPYRQAIEGFSRQLKDNKMVIEQEIIMMKTVKDRLDSNKLSKASLIFALGTQATQIAVRQVKTVPIIGGLVLSSADLKDKNVTGVYLEHPVQVQLEWLKRLLPNYTTVGVIYSPQENEQRIQTAMRIAGKLGLTIEAQPVRIAQDIPSAFKMLGNRIQVLWGLSDSLVLTPQTAKQLLLFSFRNHIPMVGPSQAWAKAGAIYSLDWDFVDIGRQCGELAHKVLSAPANKRMTPEAPRKVIYSLNQRTASLFRIEFPDRLKRSAAQNF